MARGNTINLSVKITGLRPVLSAFNKLGKDANEKLRIGSMKLAEQMVPKVKADAASDGSPQTSRVIPTIKVKKDRVPVVQAGGRKSTRGVLFGSIFGSNAYKQFHHRWLGQEGYYLFATFKDNEAYIANEWRKLALRIIEEAGL